MSGPSLADDEATLATYADDLASGLRTHLGGWVIGCVRRVADEQGLSVDHEAAAQAAAAAKACVHDIAPRVDALLATDIDDQTTGPLQIVRDAVRYPSEVLDSLGAHPVPRDRFEIEAFPDDRFGLVPASFADVDPALHEPGIRWGAAKAHVHLRRRREATA